mmetsp:Transcript_9740/g.19051  ORF Transcript_9740/g.19051 Transcript_9740/m.19051 type:complete len:118 (+) Transcript_9740:821-1174(+)
MSSCSSSLDTNSLTKFLSLKQSSCTDRRSVRELLVIKAGISPVDRVLYMFQGVRLRKQILLDFMFLEAHQHQTSPDGIERLLQSHEGFVSCLVHVLEYLLIVVLFRDDGANLANLSL